MLFENKNTEFKREYTDEIKKTIVAFANTDGGQLYIGIDDDGNVCGVDNSDGVLLQVINSIRDSVKPDVMMFTECVVELLDNKSVITVTVMRGTARPYYLAGKGLRPEGVYVRQGSSTVPATEACILHMIKETSGDSYENARSLNQQLTFNYASEYFKKKNVEFGKPQKKTLGLIGNDGTYTNLALLLSDQCPHTIKLAVFSGSKKTEFKDRREFCGSLFSQLDEVYTFIDRYNNIRSEFEGLDRIDRRDYPIAAVREVLLNAIVHRDYGLSPSTLISIFDDRIEFVTIGGLIKGLSLDDILLGVSALRNPNLANIFYRLNLIEAYGTGMQKIAECYENSSAKPNIELSNNAFKISLPNTSIVNEIKYKKEETLNPRERAVLSLLDTTESISRKDVEILCNISQPTAITLLRNMVDKKLLSVQGSGKKLRYIAN